MHLTLASTSKWRQALLARTGLPFTSEAPPFDEVDDQSRSPLEVARAFSIGKAQSLAARCPSGLIIGADQTAELDGVRLTKPSTREAAIAQLTALAGKTHRLHAGVAVFEPRTGRVEAEVATVHLTMRALSPELIARYVDHDQPLGAVGGYTYEGCGVFLFEAVEGHDESAIIGLPLLVLGRLLRRFGLEPLP